MNTTSPDKSNSPMILMRDVRLSLVGGSGPVQVLKGVDMSVEPGQALSVVGPSGSGKTTTLMIIAGLERPDAGRVAVAGQELQSLGEDELSRFRRKHVGIVFQGFHLAPTMTALENVALPLEFARIPDALDRAAQSLESVELAHRAGHYPSQLSGGEQQRVAIARAFAAGPSIILADEPTGNLDMDTGKKVMDLLFSLRERHATTLMLITHDRALSERCDRVIRMRDGKLHDE